jgi:predicted PurR-regulated permease PerM
LNKKWLTTIVAGISGLMMISIASIAAPVPVLVQKAQTVLHQSQQIRKKDMATLSKMENQLTRKQQMKKAKLMNGMKSVDLPAIKADIAKANQLVLIKEKNLTTIITAFEHYRNTAALMAATSQLNKETIHFKKVVSMTEANMKMDMSM